LEMCCGWCMVICTDSSFAVFCINSQTQTAKGCCGSQSDVFSNLRPVAVEPWCHLLG
jgi:hypothetical protein